MSKAHESAPLLLFCAVFGCQSELIRIDGASCESTSDCLVHPSCSRYQDACTCRDDQCYFDPDARSAGSDTAGCRSCHGSLENSAPPMALNGSQDAADPAVGTHQTHLGGGNASRPVSCSACHLVPSELHAAGHIDDPLPAEVTWDSLSTTDGASPVWDRTSYTCTNTYCHGATLVGGTTRVVWNDNDGSESQCGACHGMPPSTAGHQAPACSPPCNACDFCHQDSAGPNQTINRPRLHVDGVLQISGSNCSGCHESPPTPTSEDYTGGGGAHAAHAAAGIACFACHGNTGSGPTHNPNSQTVVSQAEVDILFDTTVAFAGGTSMQNGSTATYGRSEQRCAVGCHNPVVGNPEETAHLSNTVTWTGAAPGCLGCHDEIADALPQNHDIAGLGDAGCLECHDTTGHTSGTALFVDPDPNDAFSYTPGDFNGLCQTCHDSGDTYFGGQLARDASDFWTGSSHGIAGLVCSDCHTYHGSVGGPFLFDRDPAPCLASGCHDDLQTAFDQAPSGVDSHHRIEGGTNPEGDPIELTCVDCHNPHTALPHPLAASDPDDLWAAPVSLPEAAWTTVTTSYNGYCLTCHDGRPPPAVSGALNIAQALSGGTDPSGFVRDGDHTASWHREEHSYYSCLNCHHWHGSSGTTGIQRGRMLLDYIDVSNTAYTEIRDCGTSGEPGSFSCH